MIAFNLGLGVILGLCLGSLVDCLVRRAINRKSFWGRSYCDRCKKILHWYDLFPILSFVLLKGRCRYCHQKISTENLIVEIIMAILIGLVFKMGLVNLQPLTLLQVGFNSFIISVLVILTITDLKVGLIPDRIIKPAIVMALIYQVVAAILRIYLTYSGLVHSVLGKYLVDPHSGYFLRHALVDSLPLIGAVISALIIILFFGSLILITKGRGMGGGDLNLGIFMGLSLGYPYWLLAIILAFLSGSLVGVGLIFLKKKHFGQTIPFGPFLSLGSILSLLFGPEIINFYVTKFPSGSLF